MVPKHTHTKSRLNFDRTYSYIRFLHMSSNFLHLSSNFVPEIHWIGIFENVPPKNRWNQNFMFNYYINLFNWFSRKRTKTTIIRITNNIFGSHNKLGIFYHSMNRLILLFSNTFYSRKYYFRKWTISFARNRITLAGVIFTCCPSHRYEGLYLIWNIFYWCK